MDFRRSVDNTELGDVELRRVCAKHDEALEALQILLTDLARD